MARPLSSKAREKILTAAADVLINVGVSGFTVDEVARQSGVAKTTIYRHFDNTVRLLVAAIDDMIAPFPTPNTGSLHSDLNAYCDITSQITCDPKFRLLMLELLAAAAQNPELLKVKRELLSERMSPIRTVVQLAMARGEIAADIDPDFAAELAESPFLAQMVIHGLEPPSDERLRRMIDFAVAGLTGMDTHS